jgi:hypothetical protein
MSDPVCVSIVLSDLVICEQGTRKNSLIGCFNNFNCARFPFPTPLFFVTAALTNLDPEIKELNLRFRIEDPKLAHVLQSVGGTMKFGEPSNITKELVFEVPLPIPPFIIQKPGPLKIVILVNTEIAGSRLFMVNAMTAPTAQIE